MKRMVEVQSWAATFAAAELFIETDEGQDELDVPEILLEEMILFLRRLFRGQGNVKY